MSEGCGRLGERISDYVVWRQHEGDGGKTFLLGLRGTDPLFCVAAGLGDDTAQRHFVTLGRYLLQVRFRCADFAVVWPAQLDDRAVSVIDFTDGEHRRRCLLDGRLTTHDQPEDGGLLDVLQTVIGPLPAVLRRDLDSLFETFRLPLLPGG